LDFAWPLRPAWRKRHFHSRPNGRQQRNKDENAEQNTDAKETQRTLYGFRGVYVFDVTQTEGKELPTLTEVNGDVSGYASDSSSS